MAVVAVMRPTGPMGKGGRAKGAVTSAGPSSFESFSYRYIQFG